MLRANLYRTAKRSLSTQVTTLSNGLTVATVPCESAVPTVGLFVGAGSTSENPFNNGVSQITTGSIACGAAAAKAGISLSGAVARDFQSVVARGNVAASLNTISSKINSVEAAGFAQAKAAALKQAEQFELTNHACRAFEHMHATAFQNTPLALPVRGTVEALEGLEQYDVESFLARNYTTGNSVVVGAGVAHDELVKAVETGLVLPTGAKAETRASSFLGSEVRLRDDTLNEAYISIAAEGESFSSPDYYTAKLAAEIFGEFTATEPASRQQGVKLLDNVNEYHLAEQFNHFSQSYKDSGLWGFSFVSTNHSQIDDLIHFTLKQWNRLTISITETEVARAKALLKLRLASQQGASATAQQILILGKAVELEQAFAKIDSITVGDVKAWAGKRLWDQDIAIGATGAIEGMLDYNRMRNDMSMMRW